MPASVIVVTDDEPPVLNLVTVILRAYNVKAFLSPLQALAFLNEAAEPPLLLITDIVMPHMTGKELAVAFQKRFPKVPVLLMSGYTPGPSSIGPLPRSWRFLAKPFSPAQLKEAVTELIGEK